MNHPQNMLSYYSDQADLMRQIMRAQNDALVAQMEEGKRQRVSYLTMLQEQQDSARQHMFTMAYGEIQEAEPLEREAEEARAEVCECIGCLENQPNQLAHMDPGGCLYDESEEELDWGEDVATPLLPPPPPQLIRETDESISDDEVIVLNGEYIV